MPSLLVVLTPVVRALGAAKTGNSFAMGHYSREARGWPKVSSVENQHRRVAGAGVRARNGRVRGTVSKFGHLGCLGADGGRGGPPRSGGVVRCYEACTV